MAEIHNVMPAGAYLVSIKLDSDSKVRDQIAGMARSKQDVAALRDAMDKSAKFEYVDIESSSTQYDSASQKDVENFTITFAITKGALK